VTINIENNINISINLVDTNLHRTGKYRIISSTKYGVAVIDSVFASSTSGVCVNYNMKSVQQYRKRLPIEI